MEGVTKKISAYKVSIRKEYIENYIKSKRKEMIEYHMKKNSHEAQEENQQYWTILNYTNFNNVVQMNGQTLTNHLQMLNQIISLPSVQPFVDRFEAILCIIVEVFEYHYNNHYENIKFTENKYQFDSKQTVLPMIVMNQMLNFVNPNQLTKFIGSIYFEIVPHNMIILKKILILMRQMLAFSVKDQCVITDYLKMTAGITIKPMNSLINRNSIFLVLMNITANEDYAILDMVYEQNIIQNISEWIEVYGFNNEEKESIAGIYTNMIEYLCELIHKQYPESEIVEQRGKDYFLFLPIFENLVKDQDNSLILEKMVYASTHLIKISYYINQIKQYILELTEELMRQIVLKKQYIDFSGELFNSFIENSQIKGHFGWICQYLNIVLNKYAFLYYDSSDKQKQKCRLNPSGHECSEKFKVLRNIETIINTCEYLLKAKQNISEAQIYLDCQKEIVSTVIDFWCRQDLEFLNEIFVNFMKTALEVDQELAKYCFFNDKICEGMMSLLNHSYEDMKEMEAAFYLTSAFLTRLQQLKEDERVKFVAEYQTILNELPVRFQDYFLILKNQNEKLSQLAEMILNQLQSNRFIQHSQII